MKTKILFALMTAGITLLLAACSENESIDESLVITEKSAACSLMPCDSCTYDGVLTDAEIEGLMEMREEEKLAHDMYLNFYERYGQSVFQNIANSEETHTSAVLKLINGYELDDPALADPGEFNNPGFAALYTRLLAEGAESLEAAFRVAAFIEESDIADLRTLLSATQNNDVARVYTNLLDGSERHLKAFAKALNILGEVYSPQVLTEEDYAAVLSKQNGKQGQKNGAGYASRGNSGKNNTGICDATQSGTGNAYKNRSNRYGGRER